jgi:hypothetical protein
VLDSTVKRHLGKWFESKGALRTAERVRRDSQQVPSSRGSGNEHFASLQTGYIDTGVDGAPLHENLDVGDHQNVDNGETFESSI